MPIEMRLKTYGLFLLPIAASTLSASVCAQEQPDPSELKIIMARNVLHDSNFFRLPSAGNSPAVSGRGDASETLHTTTLGLRATKSFSLQRWELSYNLVDHHFSHFEELDFLAKNYSASWHWAITPRFTGTLASRRELTLNSFADVQSPSTNNRRDARSTEWDGVYDLGGAWRLTAGLGRTSTRNQQQLVGEDDSEMNSRDAGVRYVMRSGSTLSYEYRNSDGEYLNRSPSVTTTSDNRFRQQEHHFGFLWKFSEKTTATTDVAWIRRSQPNFAQRDFSGLTGQLLLSWNPTAKVRWNASYKRGLSSYQTASTNYSESDSLSVGPIWQVSEKVSVRADHNVSWREFIDITGGSNRRDIARTTSLALTWRPQSYLKLSASVQRADRASNVPGVDYRSHMGNLSVQFAL